MLQAGARYVRWIALTIAILATVLLICSGLYEAFWLSADDTGTPYGEHIRNYGLIIAAFWGGVIAVWRGEIATRQADEQRKAVDAQRDAIDAQREAVDAQREAVDAQREAVDAQRDAIDAQREATAQSDVAHRRSLVQTRLFQSVELLKDDEKYVKFSGVRILTQLVHDTDNLRRGDALRILEEFVRAHSPAVDLGSHVDPLALIAVTTIDPLVQATVAALAEKELPDGLKLDLQGVNLRNASLRDACLKRANLSGANLSSANLLDATLSDATLSGTNLRRVNLHGADLSHTDISGADLSGANLLWANLFFANLSGTNLSGAHLGGVDIAGADFYGTSGLSQFQLDRTCQNPCGPGPSHLPTCLCWDGEAAKENWRAQEESKERRREDDSYINAMGVIMPGPRKSGPLSPAASP